MPLKVGIVGCGFMGRMHANVYRLLDDAELVACVDHKPERGVAFAGDFGLKLHPTLEGMIADHDLDIVDVCLPTHRHAAAAIEALQAGKHVVCEKPMARTLAEADEMAAAALASGKQLMIAHCIRFWPEYAFLKQAKEDGRYGKLLSVNLTRYGAFPSYASDNWLADEAKSGGGVLDMHIHDTDFALYLLGTPEETISYGTVDGTGACHAFTTMRFGSTVAHLEGGWNLPAGSPFKMAFRAVFERAVLIMDGGPLTVYETGKDPVVPEFPKMSAAGGGNISDLGGYYAELAYFVDRVSKGLPVETVTPASSRESLRVCLAEVDEIKRRAGASA